MMAFDELPPNLDEVQQAFEVPDEDWRKLVLISEQFRLTPEDQRDFLGRLATYRQMLLSPRSNPGDREKAASGRAKQIHSLCAALLVEIESIESDEALHFFLKPDGGADRQIIFRECLAELSARAEIASMTVRPLPHNVDIRREIAWRGLINMFEAATNRPARVAVAVGGSKPDGAAYGAIVDFIRDFTAAVPRQALPTANQIRAFERKTRDQRSMVSTYPTKTNTARH